MNYFDVISGAPLDFSRKDRRLRLEHTLQRFRDVWVVTRDYPYLAIDGARANAYADQLEEFAVFSAAFLFQNITRAEFVERIIGGLGSPGITAGFSSKGGVLVEGMANPKANDLFAANHPIQLGTSPYCAMGVKYIFVGKAGLFQHSIGEYIAVNALSRPSSKLFDFTELADRRDEFLTGYYKDPSKPRLADTRALETLLDAIFAQNVLALTAATNDHLARGPYNATFDYEAPTLTRYGRLTHDATGAPRVEIAFALLHYEKAIREFNLMKQAKVSGQPEEPFAHAVYCVVAAAACIEAISNRLAFSATGIHPVKKVDFGMTPIQKINKYGTQIAASHGKTFTPLAAGQSLYIALDNLRVRRNAFMHGKELETDIEPATLVSTEMASLDEGKCREFLKQVRLGVEFIFSQLPPEVAPPIVTSQNVKWLGELEVP